MGKFPITPEGARELQRELEQLWKVERPRVTHEVSEAAALGDRSENAEYIYGKKRLREIDRRVRFLRQRLEIVQVIRPGEVADISRVFFGAWVTLEDDAGAEQRFRLVGPDEIAPAQGWISIQSPLGRLLVGKEEGDELVLDRPAGKIQYTIVAISYTDEA